jgi:hypothetical protein
MLKISITVLTFTMLVSIPASAQRRHAVDPARFTLNADVEIVKNLDPTNPGHTVWGHLYNYLPVGALVDSAVTLADGTVIASTHSQVSSAGAPWLLYMFQGVLANDAGLLTCLMKVTIGKQSALYVKTVDPSTARPYGIDF